MIKALLKGILSMATSIVNLVLTPINSLVVALFPDMATAIGNFTTMVNTYIGGSLAYCTQFIPPLTKNLIVMWFTFLITYYGFIWSYTAIIKIYNVIQKIKFW